MFRRAFRFRLYPTAEQAEKMVATANARRFIYNLALEQRRDFWRQAKRHGVTLNCVSQGYDLPVLRAENEWLRDAHSTPLTQALRDLDRAFANFFRGVARFPAFQSKRRHMSFRHSKNGVRIVKGAGRHSLIRVPKIGMVKIRQTRPIEGEVVNATFSHDALGWHVTMVCEIEREPTPALPHCVGIDRGAANTLALSTGELLSTPATDALVRRKKRAQRILARRIRGSNRYRKQLRRLSRITAKIARVRADWRHKATTDIARRFGTVSIEALNTAAMTRAGKGKRGLNRSILEQGWYAFERDLAYKLEERGGTLIKVDPAYTSQTCSACGTIDKASRESQASYACRHCGFAIHADTNAAINILRRSSAVVEGGGCAPDEARTDHALAA